MQEKIEAEIVHQARKLLRRHRSSLGKISKYRDRFKKRTGNDPLVSREKEPSIWKVHPHFNPIYCIKHSKYLSKVIWKKLQNGSYEPIPAIEYQIPKPNGDKRQIMVFSIPDGAVSALFHRQITNRNANIFSSNNYSYRFDRNVFDAIINMKSALNAETTFVIQYDFKKYFDSICHEYLRKLVNGNIFLLSKVEKTIIDAFIKHKYATRAEYLKKSYHHRALGVPQGSSISLFLSNIAGHELDKDLEKQGGQFIRFADDVVAVSYRYDDSLNISDSFSKHCIRSKVEINKDKSPGISIYADDVCREIRSIQEFDYLGHKFYGESILLSNRSIKRIKNKISHIIYVHLLKDVKNGLFNPNRIGPGFYDWDLITCINEIRRYLYGGLSNDTLTNFLYHNIRLPKMRGLMSFYPLVTSCEQLKSLDGWLIQTLRRALNTRTKILRNMGYTHYPLSKSVIISGAWHIPPDPELVNESLLPSLVYAWRAARKYYIRYGLANINPPSYYDDKSSY